jgi:hypothetical protein
MRRPHRGPRRQGRRVRVLARCHPGAIEPTRTHEWVRGSMREWRTRYGRPPSSTDWSRTHARRRGGDAPKRWRDGNWPPPSTVIDMYGTWAAALADALPRPDPPTERGLCWPAWYLCGEMASSPLSARTLPTATNQVRTPGTSWPLRTPVARRSVGMHSCGPQIVEAEPLPGQIADSTIMQASVPLNLGGAAHASGYVHCPR